MQNNNELNMNNGTAQRESNTRNREGRTGDLKPVKVGKAVELLQSFSWGAYEDAYTQYKWNR